MGFLQSGHFGGYAIEQEIRTGLQSFAVIGQTFALFFSFEHFPIFKYLGSVICFCVAKHMRMPMNQLVAERVKHIIDGEGALFFRHLSVKKHLK